MSIKEYAIGAIVGVGVTLGVVVAPEFARPTNPIAVVNQSTQPLNVTYTLENALGQRQVIVPAGATRSIPGALAYSDIHALAVDNKAFAYWRMTRDDAPCSGDCTLLFTADGKIRLSA